MQTISIDNFNNKNNNNNNKDNHSTNSLFIVISNLNNSNKMGDYYFNYLLNFNFKFDWILYFVLILS